jgi:hypothetical protein
MYVFDGFPHRIVWDGANGLTVSPRQGIIVKYTSLQVMIFSAAANFDPQILRDHLKRDRNVSVDTAPLDTGGQLVRVRMYGPYPLWDKIECTFKPFGLVLQELSTEYPGCERASAFFPFHKSFAAAYVCAPGVIVMTDCGIPLANAWEESKFFTDFNQRTIMASVLRGVLYAFEKGVALIDLKPDNVAFDGSCARIIDTDATVLAPGVKVENHTSFRCSDTGGSNNPVLACIIGLVIVAAVVHGASYADIIKRHHFESANIGTLEDIENLCPPEYDYVKPLLKVDTTFHTAIGTLKLHA